MQGALGERSGLRGERLREPLALRTPLLVTAVVLEGGWLAALVERSHVPVPTSVLALIGTGLLILDAFAFASTVLTRSGGTELVPALVRSPDDGIELDDEDGHEDGRHRSVREMSPAQRAGATVARVRRATGGTPAVTLVRVGHSGVELLLDDETTAPLTGFEPLETWRTWRLVDDDLDDDCACDVEVDELGSDEDGTYFAPRHEAEESTTHLVVVADGGEVIVEPYALRLRPPSLRHGASEATAAGTGNHASSDPSPPQVGVTALDADEEDVLEDAWPSDDLLMEAPLDAATADAGLTRQIPQNLLHHRRLLPDDRRLAGGRPHAHRHGPRRPRDGATLARRRSAHRARDALRRRSTHLRSLHRAP